MDLYIYIYIFHTYKNKNTLKIPKQEDCVHVSSKISIKTELCHNNLRSHRFKKNILCFFYIKQ